MLYTCPNCGNDWSTDGEVGDAYDYQPTEKLCATCAPGPVFAKYVLSAVTDPLDVEDWDIVAEFVCLVCEEVYSFYVETVDEKEAVEIEGDIPFGMCPTCFKIGQG